MERRSKVVTKRVKYGLLNSERLRRVLKNAERMPVHSLYVLCPKFTLSLESTRMKLTPCYGLTSCRSSERESWVWIYSILTLKTGGKPTLKEHMSLPSTCSKTNGLIWWTLNWLTTIQIFSYIWTKKIWWAKVGSWFEILLWFYRPTKALAALRELRCSMSTTVKFKGISLRYEKSLLLRKSHVA